MDYCTQIIYIAVTLKRYTSIEIFHSPYKTKTSSGTELTTLIFIHLVEVFARIFWLG